MTFRSDSDWKREDLRRIWRVIFIPVGNVYSDERKLNTYVEFLAQIISYQVFARRVR